MITFLNRAYRTGDGRCHVTIEEAQEIELREILTGIKDGTSGYTVEQCIIKNKDAIVNILTLNDRSRPRARGAKKQRKPKADTAAQPDLPKVA